MPIQQDTVNLWDNDKKTFEISLVVRDGKGRDKGRKTFRTDDASALAAFYDKFQYIPQAKSEQAKKVQSKVDSKKTG